jgi:membrane-bound inhibitor of C-type lysozyme
LRGIERIGRGHLFTVNPAVVYLKWANTSVTLNQQPSSIGTRYGGKDFRGSYSFWYDGDDALLQMPGSAEMSCKAEPVG